MAPIQFTNVYEDEADRESVLEKIAREDYEAWLNSVDPANARIQAGLKRLSEVARLREEAAREMVFDSVVVIA